MSTFLQVMGVIFCFSLVGGGAWIGACWAVDRWKLWREFRTYPGSGGDDVFWSEGVEMEMRRIVARKRAIVERRAQEAGASSRGEPK